MKRYFVVVIVGLVMLVGVYGYQYFQFDDGMLHVVFCDVGQGDSIFIRTPSGRVFIVDGGPDKRVLGCLSRHMGFWERNIDLMFVTHPHQDHFFGLNFVLERYVVMYFVGEKMENDTGGWKDFSRGVNEHGIERKFVYRGDRLKMDDGVVLEIEAPSKEDLERGSLGGIIGESNELASLMMKVSYGDFDILLTGDSQTAVMEKFVKNNSDSIEILQVPHHGSATGLSGGVVGSIGPKLAVISVGKGNRYGHPSQGIMDILREAGVGVVRTDRDGDVEIVSDGRRFWVK